MMQNANETTRAYDSNLHMFCDLPRDPTLAALLFLRWLAERGELEHRVFGPATGIYAAMVTRDFPRLGSRFGLIT